MRWIWISALGLVLAAMGFVAACGDINLGYNEADGDLTIPVGDDDDATNDGPPTWENFGKRFVERYCASCHAPFEVEEVPFPLVTYEDVVAEKGDCAEEVADGGMPEEYPKLSTKERQYIVDWIDEGAPKEGDKTEWDKVREIFGEKCIYCHSDPERYSADMPLDTYEAVKEYTDDIRDEVVDGAMPPSEDQHFPTDAERERFVEWIRDGAPEN